MSVVKLVLFHLLPIYILHLFIIHQRHLPLHHGKIAIGARPDVNPLVAISTSVNPPIFLSTKNTHLSVMTTSTTPFPVSGKLHSCMDLAASVLRAVIHCHHHPAPGRPHQIHRSSHALDHLSWYNPVCQVPVHAHLHPAQDGQIDVSPPDHPERVAARERAGPNHVGDSLRRRRAKLSKIVRIF